MNAPLSTQDLLRAYEALGVKPHELESIDQAPYPQNEELLKRMKLRVSKQYKRLAVQLHPDTTQGDKQKEELFLLITRVAKEFSKRTARPDLPLMAMPSKVVVGVAVTRETKPSMKVNIRRVPSVNSGQRSTREIAARIAKMRA